MKFLYFDCISGASGDMILGAFLDGHVPYDHLKTELKKLPLAGYTLELNETLKHHISSKKLNVIYENDKSHRHLQDITRLIQDSALSDFVKKGSIATFTLLGEQEARVHNMPLEKVHFHEVGAIDSIVDIVGAFICIDYINPAFIYSSLIPVSHGTIKAAHGTLPVPAPATLELLRGLPLKSVNIDGELVTPTAAAILKHISQGLLPVGSQFQIDKNGYGAGSKDFEELPNLMRIWQGSMEAGHQAENLLQLDTNIDDMNPEIYPYVLEKLFETGINDAWLTNVIMKNGRPGIQLTVLLNPELLQQVKQIIFRETTTIGFRYSNVQRDILPRQLLEIDSVWGKIQVKEIEFNGQKRRLPEYRECQRIARENNISIHEVYRSLQEQIAKQS